jgi:hypothetical protein
MADDKGVPAVDAADSAFMLTVEVAYGPGGVEAQKAELRASGDESLGMRTDIPVVELVAASSVTVRRLSIRATHRRPPPTQSDDDWQFASQVMVVATFARPGRGGSSRSGVVRRRRWISWFGWRDGSC